jgi:hypothetical protein
MIDAAAEVSSSSLGDPHWADELVRLNETALRAPRSRP